MLEDELLGTRSSWPSPSSSKRVLRQRAGFNLPGFAGCDKTQSGGKADSSLCPQKERLGGLTARKAIALSSRMGRTRDLFVHYSGIVGEGFRSLEEGDKVSFEVTRGKKGLQAENVSRG